jgi:putative ABC transport system permease protein
VSTEVQSVTLFLDAFGALALIIASTGILTMMMVSVVERERSIGLRRALGSRRAGIAAWFVGEAVLLTGAGSVVGIAAAAVASGSAMAALSPMLPGASDGLALASALRLDSISTGVVSALLAGTLFSLPPAVVAARVQPAESMRDA